MISFPRLNPLLNSTGTKVGIYYNFWGSESGKVVKFPSNFQIWPRRLKEGVAERDPLNTLSPKQLALKKFLTKKEIFSNFFKAFFTFVSSNFLVRALHCKKKWKLNFHPGEHEKTALKICSEFTIIFFFSTGLAAQKAIFGRKRNLIGSLSPVYNLLGFDLW
mgnify:CR=1 FL=1